MASDSSENAIALMRNELYYFVWAMFEVVYPGDTFVESIPVKIMCYELTECLYGETSQLALTLPPQCLKSFTISSALPAFLLGHDPSLKVLCSSYGDELARLHHRHFRVIMHSPHYQELFPETAVSDVKDTETATLTTMNGGRFSIPLGGGTTGHGADVIIVDDPIKLADVYSEVERENCDRNFREGLSTRARNPATLKKIVTMQRLHEDDLVGRLKHRKGWKVVNVPAEMTEPATYRIGPGKRDVVRFMAGELTQPGRLTRAFLDDQREGLGGAGYSAQYLGDPMPADGEMIKRDWIRHFATPVDPAQYPRKIQSWDTAVKTGKTNDYSACVTLGIRGRDIHVLDALRVKKELLGLQNLATSYAQTWKPDTILVEDANHGIDLVRHLQKHLRSAVIPIPVKDSRELRVSRAAAHIEAGRLFLPHQDQPWTEWLEREMFGFPNASNDDLLDALSQALIWYGQGGRGGPTLKSRVTLFGEGRRLVAYSDFDEDDE